MNPNRILFPIDFSGCSQELNSHVEWLARTFESHVTLLHVFEIPTSWYGGMEGPLLTGEDVAAFNKAEDRQLKEYNIHVPESQLTRVLLQGGAAWHIANWVQEHATDLIVMGTHGLGPLRRLLLGSVAMKVLHDVDCPVWTQAESGNPGTFRPIKKIVCPIELTEEMVPLLRFAKDVASGMGAQVHLLHTIHSPDDRLSRHLNPDLQQLLIRLAKEEIAHRQSEAGTLFPLVITSGHVEQDAAELVVKQEADLVLIGRGKVRGAFGSLRTHAYSIIRQAACPILSYSADWLAKEFSVSVTHDLASALPGA